MDSGSSAISTYFFRFAILIFNNRSFREKTPGIQNHKRKIKILYIRGFIL